MLLAIDFDGTLCEQDAVDWLSVHYAPAAFAEAAALLEAGRIDLDTCLQLQVAPITASEDELIAFLRETVRLRPGAAELVALCRARGVEPVVLSSGFDNLIRPLLADAGLELDVYAHRAACGPDGMRVELRGRAACPICGEACKRAEALALADGRPLGYVGDGYSDLCAAEVAELRFARASLARHLEGRGLDYRAFGDLHDVRRDLAAWLDDRP